MNKICIIGCGGSGKSTLAFRLKKILEIPTYHLDTLFWQPDWVAIDRLQWIDLQKQLCCQSAWIIDGNYGATMEIRLEAADTVIFLDMSNILCCIRVLKRQIKYFGKNRPDMAIGCNERFSLRFFLYVLGYKFTHKPSIMRRLSALTNKQIIILQSSSDVEKFIDQITDSQIKKGNCT